MIENKTAYQRQLADPRWQKKRLKVLSRDKFKCRLCGRTNKELHVHHLKYTTKLAYDEDILNLITYCKDCHYIVEYIKDIPDYDSGISKIQQYDTEGLIPLAILKMKNGSVLFFRIPNGVEVGFNAACIPGLISFLKKK